MALLVDSRYKIPWIIWARSFSLTLQPNHITEIQSVAHGLSFTPLLVGYWSTNSSFTSAFDITSPTPHAVSGIECRVGADASYLRILLSNFNSSSSSMTFYLRLAAFAPIGYTGQVTPISYPNSKFTFNSNYLYQKIYMSGSTTANMTVTHNLGYIPQAKVWTSGTISSGSATYSIVSPDNARLTTTTLSFNQTASLAGATAYYHIYKDTF